MKKETNGISATLGYIQRDIAEMKESMNTLRETFQNFEAGRLTKLEIDFARSLVDLGLLKKIVYSLGAVILLAVVGALIRMVIK